MPTRMLRVSSGGSSDWKIWTNWLADEDGVSQIRVCSDSLRQGSIPYTNRTIQRHTDVYYNPPER